MDVFEISSGHDALVNLAHRLHLMRSKSVLRLAVALDSGEVTPALCEARAHELLNATEHWECLEGGLLAAETLMKHTPEVAMTFYEPSMALLEHTEVRVRNSVCRVLGAIAHAQGTEVFLKSIGLLLDSIRGNFERQGTGDASSTLPDRPERRLPAGPAVHPPTEDGVTVPAHKAEEEQAAGLTIDVTEKALTPAETAALVCPPSPRPGDPGFRHDTEGWKSLETSFKAVQAMVAGIGAPVATLLTKDLADLLQQALAHTNRFVRETAFLTIEVLVEHVSLQAVLNVFPSLAQKIAVGLADNWSQVRYASSRACRSLLMPLTAEERAILYPELLPRMCLNRYYLAEGVKLYSQETWELVIGKEDGPGLVAKHAKEVVEFYISQSRADNHAVREAACHCSAELAVKVTHDAVTPYVDEVLAAMIDCFKDESWPVRDAASVALGNFVKGYPEPCVARLPELYELWFVHLHDNIYSVRENSAMALGNVIDAIGDESVEKICEFIRENLGAAEQQPKESHMHKGMANVAQFGVVPTLEAQKARANDKHIHSNKQMFSCGSLAPKLRRGGGCMDHGFKRATEPWEKTDGCVYMVRELCIRCPEKITEFGTQLAAVSRIRHFHHAGKMRETFWLQVPHLLKACGPHLLREFCEDILSAMCDDLVSGTPLLEAAASWASDAMKKAYSPTIYKSMLTIRQRDIIDGSEYAESFGAEDGSTNGKIPNSKALPSALEAGEPVKDNGASIATLGFGNMTAKKAQRKRRSADKKQPPPLFE